MNGASGVTLGLRAIACEQSSLLAVGDATAVL